MARLKKNILGSFQGNISNVIFRVRNGKLVAYSKPAKYKISKSEAAVSARNKFALTVAFAREINKNKTLSAIWKDAKIKATNGYQKLIKYNSQLTDTTSLTEKNVITPEGIQLSDVDVVYETGLIHINIDTSKLNKKLLSSNKLFSLIYLSNQNGSDSKSSGKQQSNMRLFEFDIENLSRDENFTLTININELDVNVYNFGLIYIALVGEQNEKLFWSSTFAKRFL